MVMANRAHVETIHRDSKPVRVKTDSGDFSRTLAWPRAPTLRGSLHSPVPNGQQSDGRSPIVCCCQSRELLASSHRRTRDDVRSCASVTGHHGVRLVKVALVGHVYAAVGHVIGFARLTVETVATNDVANRRAYYYDQNDADNKDRRRQCIAMIQRPLPGRRRVSIPSLVTDDNRPSALQLI